MLDNPFQQDYLHAGNDNPGSLAPNTAPSFAALGMAFFFSDVLNDRVDWRREPFLPCSLSGTVRLSESSFAPNIGTDSWFVRPPGEQPGFPSGRLSTFAAMGFLSASSALLLLGMTHK